MKKLMSLSLVGIVLGTIGGTAVGAAEVPELNEKDDTTTTVKIKDGAIDHQQLKLKKVPTSYDFVTALSDNTYEIASGTIQEGEIHVFNNASQQKWVVKASVIDDQLTKGTRTYPVSEFKINNQALATGAETTIFKNAELTTAKNTGTLKNNVTDVSIKFEDTNYGKLSVGDELSGQIHYQLYRVTDAK